jgi:hypothetical protein
MTPGEHNGNIIDFYGVLKEVIELQYNSNLQVLRTVVIFQCDWYNQEGKGKGLQDDGHFKSINVQSLRYKIDPFVLSSLLGNLGKPVTRETLSLTKFLRYVFQEHGIHDFREPGTCEASDLRICKF